uniref:Perforin-like protein n=1 Tax=Suberites domuncula TaxID=55567 RepID=Q86FL1_SUBDO|nr:perforin-like protein [Suberites domuncula]
MGVLRLVIYVVFYATLASAHSPCETNSCCNGATCRDTSSYTCSCRSGYSGTYCQNPFGRLTFYARYGHGLPDEDGWWNDSDPYMEIIAYYRGGSIRHTTSTRNGDHSPVWHQNIDFGRRDWTRFTVRVWDSDNNADDALSSTGTYGLSSHTSNTMVKMNCYSGYVYFDYHFQPGFAWSSGAVHLNYDYKLYNYYDSCY